MILVQPSGEMQEWQLIYCGLDRREREFLSNGSLLFLGHDTVSNDIPTQIRKENVFYSPGVKYQGNFSSIFYSFLFSIQ